LYSFIIPSFLGYLNKGGVMPEAAVDFTPLDDVNPGDELTIRIKADASDGPLFVLELVSLQVVNMEPFSIFPHRRGFRADPELTLTVGSQWDKEKFIRLMRDQLGALQVKSMSPPKKESPCQ
jgi:hypothetical protein